jgi:integrase
LPALAKRGNGYFSRSKGKNICLDLTQDMITRLKEAGLDTKAPFKNRTANSIELMVAYHVKKQYKAGKINAPYSCHDFRHFAAVREYVKDKDIKWVKDFLGHSSVAITERYLRAVGLES